MSYNLARASNHQRSKQPETLTRIHDKMVILHERMRERDKGEDVSIIYVLILSGCGFIFYNYLYLFCSLELLKMSSWSPLAFIERLPCGWHSALLHLAAGQPGLEESACKCN